MLLALLAGAPGRARRDARRPRHRQQRLPARSVPADPVNDASDVSASLTRLGYSVSTLTNARYDDLRRALIDFGRRARGAELAVIFFAGHGIQMAGENWVIPIDAQLASDLDVPNEAIGLQSMVRAVSNTSRLGLVILDACRNDPFLSRMLMTRVSRVVERGLSRVEPSDNVPVAYSARDGTTARDGTGRNSPFTASLLKNIETPGLEVRFLFANVRDDVMAATNREQQPFVYGSLSKEQICLGGCARPPEATARTREEARAQEKPEGALTRCGATTSLRCSSGPSTDGARSCASTRAASMRTWRADSSAN